MSRMSRRSALGLLAGGAVGAGASFLVSGPSAPASVRAVGRPPATPAPSVSPVEIENYLPGSRDWQVGVRGTRRADDGQQQIKGYASATSVAVGESIDFHVTVGGGQDFTVAIYRLGYYGGAGARHLVTSPNLTGKRQPPQVDEATGLITCRWPPAWTLSVPADWTSGAYLAVFTTAKGWRSFTLFVVRDDHRTGGLCVVLPFSTYQAYNQWPLDGRTGKSLYYGYDRDHGRRSYEQRAVKVSFDRPYAGDGWPKHLDRDHDFVQWAERCGYDVTYATSLDLHAGRIDPARYAGLIFCGHDEYWSRTMRDVATRAVAQGTSLAFLAANNVYWQVRFEPSADGRDHRVFACYKTAADPAAGPGGATTKWRDVSPRGADAEQRLLGIQYNGMVAAPQPLVVQVADHWFWDGCGVKDGDQIAGLVGGEADGYDAFVPGPAGVKQTLLSASVYKTKSGSWSIQNAQVYEDPSGAVVFAAGTLFWALALNREGHRDARVQRATANLLDQMLDRRRRTGEAVQARSR